MMSHQQQYLLQQEQQRREDMERQLYYASASMEDMRRQIVDLQTAYQQQAAMLEHERQQRVALVEQLKQQQAMLVEKERQQLARDERKRVNDEQRKLIERVSEEVRRFQAANGNGGEAASAAAEADGFGSESPFSREIAIVPSKIPAPNKYPHVDWSVDYSIARLEDMMEEPESSRNTLFYALLNFHAKRLQSLNVDDNACADELIKRVNEQLYNKPQT